MKVLAIESSCDETAAAVVADGHRVLASVVASQIDEHARYGGVIPELAAREHQRAIRPVVDTALADAGLTPTDLDGVAVTALPGLLPALLVGISYAKGLAAAIDRPLIPVNHIVAHVYGAFVDARERRADPGAWPVVALVVSGGHSVLFEIGKHGAFRVLGQTLDDAAGEAFDKAAKILDLGYPGGPLIDKLARLGDPGRYDFPRGLVPSGGAPVAPEHRYCFSFSGVKTSLLYHLRQLSPTGEPADLPEQELLDSIASFQEAVVDVLVTKTVWAAKDCDARTVVVCGGVACNSRLRARLADALGDRLLISPPKYCTDNAVMIAGLACHHLRAGQVGTLDLDATPRFVAPDSVPFTPDSTFS